MPPRADVSGDLLFGLLALQAGLIDQEELVSAFRAWSREEGRPMAAVLAGRGALDESECGLVAGLVEAHLRRHGGDREESLAALGVDASAVEGLSGVGVAEVETTLSLAGLGPSRRGGASAPPTTVPEGEPGDLTVDYDGPAPTGPRYRIVRRLGAGGLGEVFVAFDRVLNREVALKRVRSERRDDPRDRARFLVEAEITARLEHPGIVAVHDLGDSGDGRPFYVMRLIRGDTLKHAIDAFHADAALRDDPSARALALQKLLRRFLDVCNAVDYAHARGILHRDLKPSNVVVGAHGETIVIDWGLAKSVGHPGRDRPGPPADAAAAERTLVPASGSDVAETQPGSAMGTPSFMSPEQAHGDVGRIGPRSDVYGLGATLYQMLTGRKPFAGQDRAAILAAVEEGDFPAPRLVDPTIDRALEAVCLKAMSFRPEDRYATARELAEEVERWLADAPVLAWPEPATVRLRRWSRRHRPLVVAAAALLVMTTLASIGAALLLDRHGRRLEAEKLLTSAALAKADAALAEAGSNALRAFDAINAMLRDVFDQALSSVPGMEPLRRKLAASAADLTESLLRQRPRDPDIRLRAAGVFRRVANLDRQMNDPDPARANYDRAVALYAALGDEFPGQPVHRDLLAETLVDEAELFRMRGQPREAEPLFRRAAEIAAALRAADPGSDRFRRTESSILANLGGALIDTCRVAEARAMLERAVELRRPLADKPEATAGDGYLLLLGLIALSEARREEGQPAEAAAASDEAIRRARDLCQRFPKDNNDRFLLAFSLRERALAAAAPRPAEARAAIDESVGLLGGLAKEFPRTPSYRLRHAQALASRADLHASAGRHAEAEADWDAARALLEALIAEHPGTPEYDAALGLVLGRLGRHAADRGEPARALRLIDAALDTLGRARKANPDACKLAAEAERLDAARKALDRPGGPAPARP